MAGCAMNKIKCLICNDVVESRFLHEHAYCKCGNVSVCGGLINPIIRGSNYSHTKEANEMEDPVKQVKQSCDTNHDKQRDYYISRDAQLYALERLLAKFHELPDHMLDKPVSHRDHCTLIGMIVSILRCS